jgi:hypothetical protein
MRMTRMMGSNVDPSLMHHSPSTLYYIKPSFNFLQNSNLTLPASNPSKYVSIVKNREIRSNQQSSQLEAIANQPTPLG